CVQVMTFPYSF
nr:immunoglobulin light chain junction region [Macaca mulatta]MOW09132.1 immunoglobulin light chain junction region [Macaca mulatta]MOW09752.1 immunoglobulin light chain junction region [Macaca mulatta]MOW11303.1 immunoglobulin light chain junction region [Macaca mulatta]MOW13131.1 immunoglobulin light chain junction region [Macaca mulatta]